MEAVFYGEHQPERRAEASTSFVAEAARSVTAVDCLGIAHRIFGSTIFGP